MIMNMGNEDNNENNNVDNNDNDNNKDVDSSVKRAQNIDFLFLFLLRRNVIS